MKRFFTVLCAVFMVFAFACVSMAADDKVKTEKPPVKKEDKAPAVKDPKVKADPKAAQKEEKKEEKKETKDAKKGKKVEKKEEQKKADEKK
ncbi:MAG: hypothetical protein ACYDHW_07870 [Syntrophorhabdaceae bacterium]